jgi:hypothetical protein
VNSTVRRIFIIGCAVLVSACAMVLANDAERQLRAQCEAKGLQFVLEDRKAKEGVFVSTAQVTGYCVGPGDPRYMPPASKEAKQPAV